MWFAMPDADHTGSRDQVAWFTPPLCASCRNASAPCSWICSLTRRRCGTQSGSQTAALLCIWYAVVGCTCAWPAITVPTPPRAYSAR